MNDRPKEICAACGYATGHAGYGEDSIGYVDGTIGPLCDDCNTRLRVEIECESVLQQQLAAAEARCAELPTNGEQLARRFHLLYESMAPAYGYETRTDTREFDPTSKNGQLMVAVCSVIQGMFNGRLAAAEKEVGGV